MGLFEKDELIRVLEKLTERMAAIAALAAAGRPEEALTAIREARATLVGTLGATLDRVDGATVVALLGNEKAAVYAKLARLEADARDALKSPATAADARLRATEIDERLAR